MKIVVIGGGAAGMMAACHAANGNNKVIIFEKNDKLGKKLFITGKGRCNLTNACDIEGLFSCVVSNPKFLYSAFYGFSNTQVMEYFTSLGVELKVERGMRVFPKSDHSSDIIRALHDELIRKGVEIKYNSNVSDIVADGNTISEVILKDGSRIKADAFILAMGGKSYSSCGSTGDYIKLANKLNINIVSPEPSLVPFETKEDYVSELMGLSLKNVKGTLSYNGRKLHEDFGELLFTHFGLSGPLVLTASCYASGKMYGQNLKYSIDLKPALSEDVLDERLMRDLKENGQKKFKNSLDKLLPSKLIPVIVKLSGIDEYKRACDIRKEERQSLVRLLKSMTFTITSTRGFDEAIITRGGISTKEVDPSTMRIKKYKNLYACGEMLDLDAHTGGYNLQIAWSTGYLAGNSVQTKEE